MGQAGKGYGMDVDLPDTISAETIEQARPAVAALRVMLDGGTLPAGLTSEATAALLALAEGVAEAAARDDNDFNLSDAAERLRVARPSVMRLIARGELSSRKEGGHYVVSPRELRSFQSRLAAIRREALRELTGMAEEFRF